MIGFGKFAVSSALLCASVVSFGQVKNRIIQPIDKTHMVRLRGNVHILTQKAADLGRVDGARQLKNVTLLFDQSASQKAELQALIKQQRDPQSPNYHKWLTPEQYAARFGMSQDDLDKVSGWLRSQGFSIDTISRSRTRISFSGSVAQMESVFQTEFHQFSIDGETHLANVAEPSVPAALSGSVIGFWKMNDFRWKPRAVVKRVDPRFNSGTDTFLAPADIATIYNVNPLYNAGIDGTGHTIAVVGQTSIKLTDVNAFRAAAGLPANPPVLFLVPGGSSVLNTGDEVEADLDVEWAGAIAKNATVVYVFTDQSQAQGGVIGAFEFAIDNDIAPVVSISYGACESLNGAEFITFLQGLMATAQLQGQTVTSAIGDSGATDCEPVTKNATSATTGLTVDVPGAIAEVTAVGGTTFTGDDNRNATFWSASNDPVTHGSALQYIPETTWNDGFTSSTGGGVSSIIAKPSFQTALTPADAHRDVPDVALTASPEHDPYLVCDATKGGGTCTTSFSKAILVGGTSAGAPVFASMLTLLNQATENSGGQGTINPTLYSLAGSASTYTSAFHDITTGNNKQACQTGSTGCTSSPIGFNAGVKYDLTTGLGSIDLDNLAHAWPGFATTPKYDLSSSPTSITVASAGTNSTSTLTVHGNAGFTGSVALTCLVISPVTEIGCKLNGSDQATVNLSASTTSADVTLTVNTVAAHNASFLPAFPKSWTGWILLASSLGLAYALRNRRRPVLGLCALTLIAIGVACGGGGSTSGNNNGSGGGSGGTTTDPGTPTGSYVVAVTTTGGGVSHTINVPVTVN